MSSDIFNFCLDSVHRSIVIIILSSALIYHGTSKSIKLQLGAATAGHLESSSDTVVPCMNNNNNIISKCVCVTF